MFEYLKALKIYCAHWPKIDAIETAGAHKP